MAATRKTEVQVEEPSLIELKSSKTKPEVERVPLFSIDGEVYSVPKSVPQMVGLNLANIARKQGEDAAADYMMETLLGEDAYQALLAFDDLSEDDLKNIVEACTQIVLGASQGKH